MAHNQHDALFSLDFQADSSCATSVSTPITSLSSSTSNSDATLQLSDLKRYIALGCLHYNQSLPINAGPTASQPEWLELLFSSLPDEVKFIIGLEATRLLEASWIRMFIHNASGSNDSSIIRVYLLPEDWGRRYIDRRSKSLKLAMRDLLSRIDISPAAWNGDHSESEIQLFDPWASAENVSLFYLFNKLPSPAPTPEIIKDRYTKWAVEDLLESSSPLGDYESQPLQGLKARLYPYQARSASLMIQRESAPQLQLDPRLEIRQAPTGESFFFGARDGSFLHEPRYYESNRGGILAETMGLGKTIICLALVLATKGHLPLIPPQYQSPPRIRDHVASLGNIAANVIARNSLPAKAHLERIEADEGIDLSSAKRHLEHNHPRYEIPYEVSRMNRTTVIPPPRELLLCSGTIIVVPRNLLQQWRNEIRKHLLHGSLKILVLDSSSKRSPVEKRAKSGDDDLQVQSEFPSVFELLQYDLILFTRNRFEQEIQEGLDGRGRPAISDDSPLKQLHWLRIIIDEGHNFSSGFSNAVLVAKQLQVDRRWVVSGTPAKDLVGVEVDISSLEADDEFAAVRDTTMGQRKSFSPKDDIGGAAKALGSLASNFLMVRPWSDAEGESKLVWDEYIYRHEHQHRKTYSGFSSCFLRTLKGLVVKTRPEDVERDILLPPMKHRVVYLKPCWFDKMTANLFIQVLRANAITSERSDVDYLFHKNSSKARQSLIRNLRQSNFTWTGFSMEDVASTLETSSKYLAKPDKRCSIEDANQLLESSSIIAELLNSDAWCSLSKTHEVGLAIDEWPQESEEAFALSYPTKPAMVGITQLLEGQSHVDSHILSDNPAEELKTVGEIERARLIQIEETEKSVKTKMQEQKREDSKTGVPSSAVGGQPITSRRTSSSNPDGEPEVSVVSASSLRPKKRKLTDEAEKAQLPETSPLRNTRVVGTTSAKLSYLMEMVLKHQAQEKIIIFYDGDNAAFYIAQCLEMLYVNHRIYARSLDNIKRSQYVALFNEDPDVRVLLIDVACGALGLNLNAASVVLIVNPINRPGIEAQAIKRAHRIGQTKEVLVETLVLEGTIEEAIFNRAKKMSRNEHIEAKMLEDDTKIMDIIQNAKVIPIDPDEAEGLKQFATLEVPQQVFGRSGREKYHRFGHVDIKSPEKPTKRSRTSKDNPAKKAKVEQNGDVFEDVPVLGPPVHFGAAGDTPPGVVPASIFGGSAVGPSTAHTAETN
ncbi:P-loop containing nucleoside triphosphate hydrolase protein [Lophiotrema nucula]|uniref:P-loop containing nucleoside triphosphate hydrolase protein n=1 Tax=Lophiotrema nucula TaxID=690887 RepID=A0A6A5ZEN6_9PLEO|nr:P-loop containing nucleoside triphosphate hydrolase protein [Lophiotrema nucula]